MPLWSALLCIGVLARSVPECPRCAVVLKRASEGKQRRSGTENAERSTAIKVPLPSMPTAQKALLVEHLRERQTASTRATTPTPYSLGRLASTSCTDERLRCCRLCAFAVRRAFGRNVCNVMRRALLLVACFGVGDGVCKCLRVNETFF